MSAKDKDVLAKNIYAGMKAELEHTDDEEKALRISLDHLSESCKYYDYLKKMEAKFD